MANATDPTSTSSPAAELSRAGIGGFVRLRVCGWGLAIGWTLAVAGLLVWAMAEHRKANINEAETSAEMALQRDLAYRRWVQHNGGVYVPVSPLSPPSHDLDVPERDITTPSGRELTLVNSSYMMRQVAALAGSSVTAWTRTTSLEPLSPRNAPDAHEADALRRLARGQKVAPWRQVIAGKEYLRMMRPLLTEATCLKCHRQPGTKVGTPRGGIVASVPIPPIAASIGDMWPTATGYTVLWLCGLGGIAFAWDRLWGDFRKRKQTEQELQHAASHDALTSLPNRAQFIQKLSDVIAAAQPRPDYRFAVMFLDLDHFKVINDSLGHDAGDQLLTAMARRLHECVSRLPIACDGRMVARLGGDEFVVLLDGICDPSDACHVAEEILAAAAQPFATRDHEIHTGVSIGIMIGDPRYRQPEDVLRDADTALYRAKNAGRARYAVFDERMHESAMLRLRLENELRRAIDHDEIHAHYQPIVALESGSLEGFEALARWEHPDRGLLLPGDFIPVAEETGLIIPLGWKMLESACRQLRQIQHTFPHRPASSISVNISQRQLTEKSFIDRLAGLIERTGIEPRLLKLELTESMLMQHASSITPLLSEIRELGVTLAMDDFGTGHSSLSCLHRFPLDLLKIDRAFIANMGLNRQYAAVVHAVITLAHNLGIAVVAEGVETLDQVVQLQSLDCDFAQGYFFSKPVPEGSIPALLATQTWFRKSA